MAFTHGWPYPIERSDWAALLELYESAPDAIAPVGEVVASVARSTARHELLFTTSMWDLVVTTAPSSTPPLDVVVVRGYMGVRRTNIGRILVEHLPLSGKADAIERDAAEAVPFSGASSSRSTASTRGNEETAQGSIRYSR